MARLTVDWVRMAWVRMAWVRMAAGQIVLSGSLVLAMLASGSARAAEVVKDEPAKSVSHESDAAVAPRDDITQTTFTLDSISNPPPREIEFKMLAPSASSRSMAAGISVYRNRFVANLSIEPNGASGVRNTLMQSAAYLSASIDRRTIFGTPATGGSGTPPYGVPWGEKFAAIVDRVPAEHRPSQAVIDFFTNPKLSLVQFSQLGSRDCTLRIGADSAEQAETLAKGLLTLLDWGVSRPLQLEIWQQREEFLAQLPAGQQAADAAAKKLGPQITVLVSLSEAPTAKLVDLTVARVGAEARIKSLSKHPAADGLQKNLFEAEAGLAEIDAQISLLNDLNVYRQARAELRRVERGVKEETAALAIFAPITLVDNQIQIVETGNE